MGRWCFWDEDNMSTWSSFYRSKESIFFPPVSLSVPHNDSNLSRCTEPSRCRLDLWSIQCQQKNIPNFTLSACNSALLSQSTGGTTLQPKFGLKMGLQALQSLVQLMHSTHRLLLEGWNLLASPLNVRILFGEVLSQIYQRYFNSFSSCEAWIL